VSVSALILTLNEEVNIARCLESLRWCDDVVVLDSGSSDRTVTIAEAFGARVVHRPFDDWSTHQNWAGRNIPFKHRWVYYSDADEIVPEDLASELIGAAADVKSPNVAYRLRYKNIFQGRWIAHCGIYPVWVLRFFRPERVRWERSVNPIAVVDGSEGRLKSHFEHHSFSKGLEAWIDKHNRYSSLEAREAVAARIEGWPSLARLFSANPTVRRQILKHVGFLLPFRPTLRFAYMYLLRRGFMDGAPGFTYCRLLRMYEAMIDFKIREFASDTTSSTTPVVHPQSL